MTGEGLTFGDVLAIHDRMLLLLQARYDRLWRAGQALRNTFPSYREWTPEETAFAAELEEYRLHRGGVQ